LFVPGKAIETCFRRAVPNPIRLLWRKRIGIHDIGLFWHVVSGVKRNAAFAPAISVDLSFSLTRFLCFSIAEFMPVQFSIDFRLAPQRTGDEKPNT